MEKQSRRTGQDSSDIVEHKRRRRQRKTRRAYIRSIHLLPSMATLGNAICGFAAIYLASLNLNYAPDPWTQALAKVATPYELAAYLIFIAMIFDGLDGRLARFTRHTTDFGGQLDSMADVISFGIAPAILMLQYAKVTIQSIPSMPFIVTRTIWAIGALYAACAAIRLARFNVSNQHGEQHHFSFLGMPSPGAAGVVAAMVLMDEAAFARADEMYKNVEYGWQLSTIKWMGQMVAYAIPVMTLIAGLLMVSKIRYPHLVNRFLKGKKSVGQLMVMLFIGVGIIVLYKYALAIAMIAYTFWGLGGTAIARFRRKSAIPVPATPTSTPSAPQP